MRREHLDAHRVFIPLAGDNERPDTPSGFRVLRMLVLAGSVTITSANAVQMRNTQHRNEHCLFRPIPFHLVLVIGATPSSLVRPLSQTVDMATQSSSSQSHSRTGRECCLGSQCEVRDSYAGFPPVVRPRCVSSSNPNSQVPSTTTLIPSSLSNHMLKVIWPSRTRIKCYSRILHLGHFTLHGAWVFTRGRTAPTEVTAPHHLGTSQGMTCHSTQKTN
ncbi:hypothetical protein QBC45DRAFT_61443 [Copromyces sp. CBS 386.78]|nr:hypothetical protein QBC45DRAFT_61443 [Copromyces sp. CBS 386.78]